MPQVLSSTDLKLFRPLLSKSLEFANWYPTSIFRQFTGFIGSKDINRPMPQTYGSPSLRKMLKPTGRIIEVVTDFEHDGSKMEIPISYPLTGKGTYGDKQLLGNEESLVWAYKQIRLNQVRKSVDTQKGKMSKQHYKKMFPQIVMHSKDSLVEWFGTWNDMQNYLAILEGFGSNHTESTVNGGLGITRRSHPNFFSNGSQVSFNQTASTYETNVATALGTLNATGESVSTAFSTETIDHMIYEAARKRIKPVMTKDGNSYYIIIINPAQAKQLKSDDRWISSHENANNRGENNPLFTGQVEGIYNGALIVVDQRCPGAKINGMSGYDSDYGTTNYGNSNYHLYPEDTSPIKMAILLGQSAISCGYGQPLDMEEEVFDYSNRKSHGAGMIIGYERTDIIDEDGAFGTAGNFKENTSSLVYATYSPTV